MTPKYQQLKDKYLKLELDLSNLAIINDAKKLKVISQEYNELKPIFEKIVELENLEKNWGETKSFATSETDEAMRSLAEVEVEELSEKIKQLEQTMSEMTRTQDPLDKKKCDCRNPRWSGR